MSVPLEQYLVVGAILFVLGAVGFLTRRNLITLFLCAELMLQGVTLNFVAFSKHHGQMTGQVFSLMIITIAACEAGLALALILVLYNSRRTLDVSVWQDLRESGLEQTIDTEPLPAPADEAAMPRLQEAGKMPTRRRGDSYV
ncbi:MAG: NADH-quinone oxidoreductase subunit NuoK [Gemmataceae bacterium]|nr:NADH-quinone oxidoreductase subunit NuoK [Gemmataceae bacterium]